MTITLTPEQERELWAEAKQNSQQNLSEPFESHSQVPKQLGKGYTRSIEVYPQVWLGIGNYKYYDDVLEPGCECVHPLQFVVRLSGKIIDEFGKCKKADGEYIGFANNIQQMNSLLLLDRCCFGRKLNSGIWHEIVSQVQSSPDKQDN